MKKLSFNKYILTDKTTIQNLEQHLLPFLKGFTASVKNKEYIETAHRNQVEVRFNNTMRFVVPWVMKAFNLNDKIILEIGCGSGCSTSAFAFVCKHIHAYDINKKSLFGASLRADFFCQQNITFHFAEPKSLLDDVKKNHEYVDAILLFAVVEHMTIEERLQTLRLCWDMLGPGGILIIAGTPNRFSYFDYHTSQLPFFHLLPTELATRYINRSPRKPFAALAELPLSDEELRMKLIRWGLGVSYHEFQLAFGTDNLHHLTLCDGYEEDICAWYGNNIEQKLLQTFFLERKIDVPLGFSRAVLNLIFQKPKDEPGNETYPYLASPYRNPKIVNYEKVYTQHLHTLSTKKEY